MPQFSFPVFSKKERRVKRGPDAESMLTCPKCKEVQGVFLTVMKEMDYNGVNNDGQSFYKLFWERWQCLNCRNVWVERFGLKQKSSIVASILSKTPRQGGCFSDKTMVGSK